MPRTQLLTQLLRTHAGPELRVPCASREELVAALRADYPFVSRAQAAHWLRSSAKRGPDFFIPLTPIEAQALRSGGIPAACPHCARAAPIAYQDRQVLVLNKPPGLPSRPALLSDAHSAVQAALAHAPELGGVPEQGLLHRLDTGTSGLIALARDAQTRARLRSLWTDTGVEKRYEAIVRRPSTREGLAALRPRKIGLEIGHSAKSAKRMIARAPTAARDPSVRGRWLPALTEILEVLPSPDGIADHALVRVRISTGVRHQIRVHLAAIGAPIVGDPLYSREPGARLMLHAAELRLPGRPSVRAPFNFGPEKPDAAKRETEVE